MASSPEPFAAVAPPGPRRLADQVMSQTPYNTERRVRTAEMNY
jgi:hypothetical protein